MEISIATELFFKNFIDTHNKTFDEKGLIIKELKSGFLIAEPEMGYDMFSATLGCRTKEEFQGPVKNNMFTQSKVMQFDHTRITEVMEKSIQKDMVKYVRDNDNMYRERYYTVIDGIKEICIAMNANLIRLTQHASFHATIIEVANVINDDIIHVMRFMNHNNSFGKAKK